MEHNINIETVDREVAIYWDYENIPLPPWCNPAEAAKSIHNAVSKYGRVVERRVYFDYQKFSTIGGSHDCSGMDLSGFDLVNTPTRNSKETLDKKLIADVLTFAWDSSQRNDKQKPCIVLLTSDGDYAYTLAKLRDRGVQNVVIFGKDCTVAQILIDNADISLSFEKDVLSFLSTRELTSNAKEDSGELAYVFLKNLPKMQNVNDLIRFLERDHKSPVQYAALEDPDPSENCNCSFAHVKFVRSEDGKKLINLANTRSLLFRHRIIIAASDKMIPPSVAAASGEKIILNSRKNNSLSEESVAVTNSDISRFCVCLHNEQMSMTNSSSARTGLEYEKCWVPNSPFISVFRATLPHVYGKIEIKKRNRAIFDNVVSDGYITVGRRHCGERERYVGVAWFKNRGIRTDLSTEIYLRLTIKGRLFVQKIFHSRVEDDLPTERSMSSNICAPSGLNVGACVRFANLPPYTKVNDFVEFIETLGFTIQCATISNREVEPNSEIESNSDVEPNFIEDRCWASVQFTTVRDGVRIVYLAITEKIMYLEREIKAYKYSSATSMIEMVEKGSPELCYMKTKSANNIPESILLLYPNSTSDNVEKNPLIAEAIAFCNSLHSLQKLQGNTDMFSFDKCWVPYSDVVTSLQSFPLRSDVSKNCHKEIVKVTRDIIILDGLVEVARRTRSGNKEFTSVSWFDNHGIDPGLSREFFLRLTAGGRSFHHMPVQNTKILSDNGKEETAYVFLKNLPCSIHVIDLVQYLEVDLHATVQQARIEHPVCSSYSNAHVEFTDTKDGLRLVNKETILEFSGMRIHACIDKNIPQKGLLMEKDPMFFYEKKFDSTAFEASGKRVILYEDISMAVHVLSRCLNKNKQTHSVSAEQCWETAAAVADRFRVELINETKCRVILSKHSSDEIYRQARNQSILDGYLEVGYLAHSMSVVSKPSIIPVSGLNKKGWGCDMAESYLRLTLKGRSLYLFSTTISPYCNVAGQNLLHTAAFEEDETSDEIGSIIVKSDYIEEDTKQINISQVTNELFSDGRRQVEVAVAAKDFQQAMFLQNDIDKLEKLYHSYPTITLMVSNLLLLKKDLPKAISARDFTKAGSIQHYIEYLETNISTCKFLIQFGLESLKKELEEAIAKRDFPRVGSIQERIETLDKGVIAFQKECNFPSSR